MKKDKAGKGEKQQKRDAFMSFLETSATPATATSEISEKKAASDHEEVYEEYTEQFTNCNVCGNELETQKRKKCQFCSLIACSEHMRKRRKKKGKWEKICDSCEDKYLYDVYMKLESKADEALAVQEEITILKHDNFAKEAEERREKRREIGFKTMALQQKYQEETSNINEDEKKLQTLEQQVDSTELSLKQLQAFVERVTITSKENYQQSWNILSQQNARMAKQLTKLEKKAMEIKAAIDQREGDIQTAFQAWQQKQFKKKLQEQAKAATKKKESCEIY